MYIVLSNMTGVKQINGIPTLPPLLISKLQYRQTKIPAQIRFRSNKPHITTKMNDNINTDSTLTIICRVAFITKQILGLYCYEKKV